MFRSSPGRRRRRAEKRRSVSSECRDDGRRAYESKRCPETTAQASLRRSVAHTEFRGAMYGRYSRRSRRIVSPPVAQLQQLEERPQKRRESDTIGSRAPEVLCASLRRAP